MGCMVEKCLRRQVTLAEGEQAECQTTVGPLPGKKLLAASANAGAARAKPIPWHV